MGRRGRQAIATSDCWFCALTFVNRIPGRFSPAQATCPAASTDTSETGNRKDNRTRVSCLQVRSLDLNPALAKIPAHAAYCSRTHVASHLCLKWNAQVPSSTLKQSSTYCLEQASEALSVYGLLEKKSSSDGECLLHGFSVAPSSNDNNWSRFIPRGIADPAGKIETVQVWQFQIQENPIKLLRIDYVGCFLAIADRVET